MIEAVPDTAIDVIEVAKLTEAHVLDAAFDVLERDGCVTMRALRRELRWNNRQYSVLQEYYRKWVMSSWQNGDRPDGEGC